MHLSSEIIYSLKRSSCFGQSFRPSSGNTLIFVGTCIVIYSYSITNKMHLLSQIIYSLKRFSCFARSFRPSSGNTLIFVGTCIVIYSYSTTKKMHLLSHLFFKTLFVFRTVFPSTIRKYINIHRYVHCNIFL
jgi:hypothetical protein